MVDAKKNCVSLNETWWNDRFGEFARGVAMSGVRPIPTESEMKALFESFDLNHDGSLSYSEMIGALEREARPAWGTATNGEDDLPGAHRSSRCAISGHKQCVQLRDGCGLEYG